MKAGMAKVAIPERAMPSSIPGTDHVQAQLEPVGDKPIDLEQFDRPPYDAVPVEVHGVVNVRNLPSIKSSHRTQIMDVNLQNIVPILDNNPKIKRAVVTATGAAWIGTKEELTTGATTQGFFLPANMPVVFECFDRMLWALAGDNTSAPKISVRQEYWAD
jgi:hypothetical protein